MRIVQTFTNCCFYVYFNPRAMCKLSLIVVYLFISTRAHAIFELLLIVVSLFVSTGAQRANFH